MTTFHPPQSTPAFGLFICISAVLAIYSGCTAPQASRSAPDDNRVDAAAFGLVISPYRIGKPLGQIYDAPQPRGRFFCALVVAPRELSGCIIEIPIRKIDSKIANLPWNVESAVTATWSSSDQSPRIGLTKIAAGDKTTSPVEDPSSDPRLVEALRPYSSVAPKIAAGKLGKFAISISTGEKLSRDDNLSGADSFIGLTDGDGADAKHYKIVLAGCDDRYDEAKRSWLFGRLGTAVVLYYDSAGVGDGKPATRVITLDAIVKMADAKPTRSPTP